MTEADPTAIEPDPTAEASEGLTKYLVSTAKGDFVIELPSNWKVTFGAVNPGGNGMGRHDLHCLRVWESYNRGQGLLRAVFCDVRQFRDLSLPLMRKIEVQTGTAQWTSDSLGNFESQDTRAIEASWEEDDAPDAF